MWITAKHTRIDQHGRSISTEITVNMEKVIAYFEIEENRTRLFLEIGHDVEDHRTAKWLDVNEPKSKVDEAIQATKIFNSDQD